MKKAKRTAPAVNAGSMADIAFLLLIFFLVTTTIVEDEGILVRLPIWAPDPPTTELLDSDVLTVKVNKANQLLVESKKMPLSLCKTTEQRVMKRISKSTTKSWLLTTKFVMMQHKSNSNNRLSN